MKKVRRSLFAAALLVSAVTAINCDVLPNRARTKVFYGVPPNNFEAADFNDKSWIDGHFPLGSCPTCPEMEELKPFFYFPGNSVATTRTYITLNAAPTKGSVFVRAGNEAEVFVNGQRIGTIRNAGCDPDRNGYPSTRRPIPDGLLKEGENLVVIRVRATTDSAFLNMNLMAIIEGETCDKLTRRTCTAFGDRAKTKALYVTEETTRPADWFKRVIASEDGFEDVRFPLGSGNLKCSELRCTKARSRFPLNSMVVTRSEFYLKRVPLQTTLRVIVDNRAIIYLNGRRLGDARTDGCPNVSRGTFIKIPRTLLQTGRNVIAMTATDTGFQSFLSMELYVTGNTCLLDEPPVDEVDCVNTLGNFFCRRGAEEGRCERERFSEGCVKECNPQCFMATPTPSPTPEPCMNVLGNFQCRKGAAEGKCERDRFSRLCAAECDPECGDEPEPTPHPCDNRCRLREACVEHEGEFFCVDCGIFVRPDIDMRCCVPNGARDNCVEAPALNGNGCTREEEILLNFQQTAPAVFRAGRGDFCGEFTDFRRNGATFPVDGR